MTSALEGFFSSGRIADLVLAFMVVEVAILVALRVVARRGVPLGDLVWITASGACLILALRAALTGAAWWWIGLALSGSLASHLMDLRRRWSPSST